MTGKIDSVNESSIRLGRKIDWILTILFLIVALGFIYMIRNLPFRAVIFPCFITALIVLNVIVYSLQKLKNPGLWDASYSPELKHDADVGLDFVLAKKRPIVITFVAFFSLSAMTFLLGQLYATPLFVSAYLLFRKENVILAIASGLVLWGIIRFVFIDFMSLNLPTGYFLGLL